MMKLRKPMSLLCMGPAQAKEKQDGLRVGRDADDVDETGVL